MSNIAKKRLTKSALGICPLVLIFGKKWYSVAMFVDRLLEELLDELLAMFVDGLLYELLDELLAMFVDGLLYELFGFECDIKSLGIDF